MLPNKLSYSVRSFLNLSPMVPAAMFHGTARFVLPSRVCHGTRLVSALPDGIESFTLLINDALALVMVHAPVHYTRIRREVRTIIEMPSFAAGQYFRLLKVCIIDPSKFINKQDRPYIIKATATVLVHLATHGSLYSRRILATRSNAVRIESICYRKMELFARRLGLTFPALGDVNLRPPTLFGRLRTPPFLLRPFDRR